VRITVEMDPAHEFYDRKQPMRVLKSTDMAMALWDIDQLCFRESDYIEIEEIKEVFCKYFIELEELIE